MTIVAACPVCRTDAPIALDNRPRVPVLQNRVYPDRESARAAPTGRLDMAVCRYCGFGWNRAFDPALMVYDPAYDNDQMGSAVFRTHVAEMSQRLVAALPADRPVHLVEVGCGQGAFLDGLASGHSNRFLSLTGFDPAWRGDDRPNAAGTRIFRRYLDETTAASWSGGVEFVVARHTIEHIADPVRFLATIRATMAATPGARLFLETPDVDWIIRNFRPEDLFYEHCSLFSEASFNFALAAAGFETVRIERVFSGQYFWVEARPGERHNRTIASKPAEAESFHAERDRFITGWRARIAEHARSGPVWIWGAASKGVTFTLIVDPEATLISGAIDINPAKMQRFLAVTGLRVEGPEALPSPATVIVMNANYRAEIAARVAALGKRVTLLDIDAAQ